MTVSMNTQSFHDVRYRIEQEGTPEEDRRKIIESYGYDVDEYRDEYNKFHDRWEAGEINPEEGFGNALMVVPSAIGKAGEAIIEAGDMFLPEFLTDAVEEAADTVGGYIPEELKKAFVDVFDPYHGEGLGGTTRDVVSEIGAWMIPYTGIAKGLRAVGVGGKALNTAGSLLGTNAIMTTTMRPDESIRNMAIDYGFIPERFRITDDDPDNYRKQFIDNLGLEVAFFGLGKGIGAGAKGIKGTGIAKDIGSKFSSRYGTDDELVRLTVEAAGAGSEALTRARGFNSELEKELQNKNLYNEDYLENTVNKALGGDQAALGRLGQDSTIAARLVTDMRNEIDTLSRSINDKFVVDSTMKATIDNNLGTYLNRSYKAFDEKGTYKVKGLNATDRNNARNYFMSKGMSAANADAALKRLVEQTDKDSFLDTFAEIIKPKGVGTSSTPLKSKKDLPPEIQAVLGPINNPFKNFSNTLEKLSVIQAEHDFLEGVARHMRANRLAYSEGTAPVGATQNLGDIDRKVRGISQLIKDDKLKNPLEGLYADKHYRNFIREGLDTDGFWGSDPNSFLRAFLKLKSASQISKTVLSPATHGRNMFGNMVIMTANGLTPSWKGMKQGLSQVSSKFKNPSSREAADQLAKYQRYGIVDSGVSANIIRKTALDALKNKTPSTWMDKLMKRSGGEAAFKLYQAEDDMFKIMHFEKTLAAMKRAHPNMSEIDVERLAAQRTRDLMPNYNLVPKAFKKLRGAPVGDFLAFPAEMTRISKNLLKYTMQDLTSGNATLVGEGMKRLAGLGVAGIAGDAAQNYTANLFGITPDQEKALNKIVPAYAKDTAKIFLSPLQKDGKGHTVLDYVDVGPIDPFEYLKVVARKAFRLADKYFEYGEAPSEQEIFKTTLETLDQVMGPYLGSSMITDALLNIVNNGGEIDTTNDIEQFIKNSGVEIGKLFEPGAVKLLRNRYNFEKAKAIELTGEENPTIDTFLADPTGREVTRYGYSMPASAGNIGDQFLGKKRLDITRGMRSNILPITSRLNKSSAKVKEVLGNYNVRDPQTIVDAYYDSQIKKSNTMVDLRNLIGAYEHLLGNKFIPELERGMREDYGRPQIPLQIQGYIQQARDNSFMPDDLSELYSGLAIETTGSPILKALPTLQQLYQDFEATKITKY